MSGRALRRLPVLALARYLGLGSTSYRGEGSAQHSAPVQSAADIDVWLDGMEQVIQEQMKEREHLQQ